MKFRQCSIFLLETSTDSFISHSKSNEDDPRVFKRIPKNIGIVGMVLRENKLFYSDYFCEAMLYDEESCKNPVTKLNEKPSSIISIALQPRSFDKPSGVILMTDKINNKPISEKDIGRMEGIKTLLEAVIENICFISCFFKSIFKIKALCQEALPLFSWQPGAEALRKSLFGNLS